MNPLNKTLALLLLSAPLVASLPAFAQTGPAAAPAVTSAPAPKDPLATPGVDKRQVIQEQRIQQGVQSGALTGKEAARMEKGQEHVQKIEDKAKADGVVTKQERARLHQAENVESRRIFRQKHDRQHDLNHDGQKDRPAKARKH